MNQAVKTTPLAAALLAVGVAFIDVPAGAEQLPISNTPLGIATAIAPNVFLEVDDSGSMDWEILTQPYWHFCAYDPRYESAENLVGQDCNLLLDDGNWRSYDTYNQSTDTFTTANKNYVYRNSDNAYVPACTNTLESCNSNLADYLGYQLDWRVFSADFNTLAYDPDIDYRPWNGPCADDGSPCVNASFSAARSNPYAQSDGYPITRNLDNFMFEMWVDDKGYSGAYPRRGANHNETAGANGKVDLWDTHKRYTVIGDRINIKTYSYTPDTGPLNAVLVSEHTLEGSGCFRELAPGNPDQCRTIGETKRNIANWYQYHRKRSYVTKGAIATVVADNPGFRYGLSVINQHTNLFVEVPAAEVDNFTAHNQAMLSSLFKFDWQVANTPLRVGLKRTGDYFDDTLDGRADPIIGSCQKNFAILFTDGYWNDADNAVNLPGDKDGDGLETTLADVARHYYDTDLSPLANDVPVDDFDDNDRQHMVTFGVAFGVNGRLTDTDSPADGWPDDAGGENLAEDGDWGNPRPVTNNLEKIDDLWHAAYNSRGAFIAASTPSEVVGALQDALQNIEHRTASAAAVAVNSGYLGTDTTLYQALFNSSDWSGELRAIAIDVANRNVGDTLWKASNELPTANSRTILTHNGDEVDDGGSAFRWNSLSDAQRNALRQDLRGDDDDAEIAAAQQRLNYLRGDASHEQRNGGNLRNRPATVLGDIVNSAPAFVGAPTLKYPDSLEEGDYSEFAEDHAGRTPVVYVNANDGALHGFNADTGEEVLAYVPNEVFNNLYQLTNPRYSHRYFVDGSPTVGDAYFDPDVSNGGNKQWRTVLVSGLNKGGQAIFALDVTDPDDFSESNPDTVLWEFRDADDTNGAGDENTSTQYALGDTFSQPAIVRLHNGQWAAVFGNGYNNTRNDGHVSVNGDAVLYLLDIGTGAVIRKISTRTGHDEDPAAYVDERGNTVYRRRANGLSSPSMVDTDGDRVVDYVYAGDLFGNLWKFDLRSSDPADWDVAFKDDSDNPRPLFTACAGDCRSGLNDNHQPITTRPRVGRSPDGRGMMIYFGTGKYLGASDVADKSLQTLYGIIDSTGQPVAGRSALQQQSIITEVTVSGVELRITTEHQIGQLRGWYLDFDSPVISGREGERLVQTPLLRGGRLIFNTLIPTSDSCGFGGSSWLMELNAYTGGRLLTSPFDVNGDAIIDKADLITVTIDGREQIVPASGIREDKVRSAPTVIGNGNDTLIVSGDSSGGVSVTIGSDGDTVKRQSWRQLR